MGNVGLAARGQRDPPQAMEPSAGGCEMELSRNRVLGASALDEREDVHVLHVVEAVGQVAAADLAVVAVDTGGDDGTLGDGGLEALVGNLEAIVQRGVGEGDGGGVGNGTGYVGHGIVYDAVDYVDWVAMRGGVRRLEAASLVDGDIDEHGAFLHQREHVLGDELGRSIAGNEHRTDDDIGGGQFLADVMLGGIEGVHIGRHLGSELFQTGQRHIGDGDIGSHAGSDTRCRLTHGAASQYEHAGRLHAGHASHEFSLSTLCLLQVVGSVLGSHPAGHLTHGNEQRQRAVIALNGLVGNAGGTALQHGAGELFLAGEMEVGEDHLSLPHQGIFRGDWLLDLDNHVSLTIDVVDGGQQLRAHRHVVIVGETTALPGSMLHVDAVSTSYQLGDTRRCHAHTVLIVLNLLGNSNFHTAQD